jgi:hypothetical protein
MSSVRFPIAARRNYDPIGNAVEWVQGHDHEYGRSHDGSAIHMVSHGNRLECDKGEGEEQGYLESVVH